MELIFWLLGIALILALMELRDWRDRARFRKLSAEIRGQRRKIDELSAKVHVALEGLQDFSEAREVLTRVDTAVQGMTREFELRLRVNHEQADYVRGL